jgi:hypothetical protein
MDEDSIFAAAMRKPPEERSAFVAQACGGDEEVRRRVEARLETAKPGRPLRRDPPPGRGDLGKTIPRP